MSTPPRRARVLPRIPPPPGRQAVRLAVAVLAWLLGGQAVPLAAEELADPFFGDIAPVVNASKYEARHAAPPASVTIVTAQEIERYGYRTLGDLLRSLRGFHVYTSLNREYVGVRGFGLPEDENTRILLRIDGQPHNSFSLGRAPIGTEFPVPLELIDRVEVVRGASHGLRGSQAFLGAIDVITKRGRDLQGAELAGEVRDHHGRRRQASFGERTSRGLEVLASTSHLTRDGPTWSFPELGGAAVGGAPDLDRTDASQTFLKIGYQDLELSAGSSESLEGDPTGSSGTIPGDARNLEHLDERFMNLRYRPHAALGSGLTARLGWREHSFRRELPTPGGLISVELPERVFEGEVRQSWDLAGGSRLVLGADFMSSYQLDVLVTLDPTAPFAPLVPLAHLQGSRRSHGVYLDTELRLGPDLKLGAGLRRDRHDLGYGTAYNPRASLSYQASPREVLKLVYAETFRAPTQFERQFFGGAGALPAEENRSWEASWERQLDRRFRLALSGFYYQLENLVSPAATAGPASRLQAITRARGRGLDLELSARSRSGWRGTLNLAYQDAHDEASGSRLPNAPRFLGSLGVVAPLAGERLSLGLELQHVGERTSLGGNRIGSYLTGNVTLSGRELLGGLDVSLGVYNFLDRRYYDPGNPEHLQDRLEQGGRTYRIRFTRRF